MQKEEKVSRQCKGAKRRTLAQSCEPLTREWDILKNGELTPFDVLRSDTRRVYWRCQKCGHGFQDSVKNRYYRKSKCPKCWGRSVKEDRICAKFDQSLGYLYPYLMKEWHPTLNGRLNAFEIMPASTTRVWWKCLDPECGHQWRSRVAQRVYRGSECPACVKRANSIETRYPELTKEWEPVKNKGIQLFELNPHLNRLGIWTCVNCLNDYEMRIQDRVKSDAACPHCQATKEARQRARLYLIRSGQRREQRFNRVSRMKVYQLRHL